MILLLRKMNKTLPFTASAALSETIAATRLNFHVNT